MVMPQLQIYSNSNVHLLAAAGEAGLKRLGRGDVVCLALERVLPSSMAWNSIVVVVCDRAAIMLAAGVYDITRLDACIARGDGAFQRRDLQCDGVLQIAGTLRQVHVVRLMTSSLMTDDITTCVSCATFKGLPHRQT